MGNYIKKYDFYNNVRFSLSSGIKDIDDIIYLDKLLNRRRIYDRRKNHSRKGNGISA